MNAFLENTKIATKVLGMLLMLAAITAGIVAYNGFKLSSVDARYSELVNGKVPAVSHLIRVNRFSSDMVRNAYGAGLIAPGSPEARDNKSDLEKAFQGAIKGASEAARLDPELKDREAEVRPMVNSIYEMTVRAVELHNAGRASEGAAAAKAADKLLADFSKDSLAFNSDRIKFTEAASADLSSEVGTAVLMTILISLAGVVAGLAFAIYVVKQGLTTPISNLQGKMRQLAAGDHNFDIPCVRRGDELGRMAEAILVFRDTAIAERKAADAKKVADAEQQMVVETVGKHLNALSQGDLTASISADFPPTYAELKSSFNAAIESLRDLIASVAASAQQIRTGSGEIAQASEDLARRTESNAASLEETSAAIAQIDGRLKATATAAGRTVERADQAIATVGGGRSIADGAVQAMGRVSDSAKGIDDVIEGLDKIAFQTRVLAMNAAVEAGRAGEAGRGFAVVADLVSALAMRAEEEAKRARDQLTVTQTDIATAVDAVQKVDGALANISSDVGEVHQLLNTMAADNQAQASAITQISAAITSMDQATQQNAAMVEETSAAARNLTTEVDGLAEQASQFRVDERERGASRVVKARQPSAPIVSTAEPKKPKKTVPKEAIYNSPVKPLPANAVAALTRPDEDWNTF